jgi:siroheme synthase (precorrin-2 oxidase/ferrochelatase)
MVSSGMLGRVAHVRTDISEKLSASYIRVTRIGELGTTLVVTSNRRRLRSSSDTSVLTRATWHNIPEDTILHSHRHENLKSFIENIMEYHSLTVKSIHR